MEAFKRPRQKLETCLQIVGVVGLYCKDRLRASRTTVSGECFRDSNAKRLSVYRSRRKGPRHECSREVETVSRFVEGRGETKQ